MFDSYSIKKRNPVHNLNKVFAHNKSMFVPIVQIRETHLKCHCENLNFANSTDGHNVKITFKKDQSQKQLLNSAIKLARLLKNRCGCD